MYSNPTTKLNTSTVSYTHSIHSIQRSNDESGKNNGFDDKNDNNNNQRTEGGDRKEIRNNHYYYNAETNETQLNCNYTNYMMYNNDYGSKSVNQAQSSIFSQNLHNPSKTENRSIENTMALLPNNSFICELQDLPTESFFYDEKGNADMDYNFIENNSYCSDEVQVFSSVPQTRFQVIKNIETIIFNIISNIIEGYPPRFQFHSRVSNKGVVFDNLLGFRLLLNKSITRVDMLKSPRRFMIIMRTLELIFELLRRNIYATKRDIYYLDQELFKDQSEVDIAIDDIACMIQVSRLRLHCVASTKGLVIGDIRVRYFSDEQEHTKLTSEWTQLSNMESSTLIPYHVQDIQDLISDAKFVLIIEKEAIFQRLVQDEFHLKYPCILLCGIGYPDVISRNLVCHLEKLLKKPIFCLVDCDPYGFDILCCYKYGSRACAFDSESLTAPSIQWLGLFPSDILQFHISKHCLSPLAACDIQKLEKQLSAPFLHSPELQTWRQELELMRQVQLKAEIQSLNSCHGMNFLQSVYLRTKLASFN